MRFITIHRDLQLGEAFIHLNVSEVRALAAMARQYSVKLEDLIIGSLATPKTPSDPIAVAGLTPREARVAELVAQGFSNKEIATTMLISEQTAKNHLHNIFDKLHVKSRAELASVVTASLLSAGQSGQVEKPDPVQ